LLEVVADLPQEVVPVVIELLLIQAVVVQVLNQRPQLLQIQMLQ
jgi:hypothetical protein